jgi:plastocyanin
LHTRHIAVLFVLLSTVLALASTAGAGRSVVQTVAVTAGKPSEFKFTVVTNSATATLPHDFRICSSPRGSLTNTCVGKTSKMVSPGVKTTLTFTFKTKGTYEYLCTVPGHAAAGMKGLLKVT